MTRQQHDFDMATAERVNPRDVDSTIISRITEALTSDAALDRMIRSLPRDSEMRHALVKLRWTRCGLAG